MDTTQYGKILRALADFAENASPAAAENLLSEVTELTRGLATPRFKWIYDEQKNAHRLHNHNRGDKLLATIKQSEVTGRWLVYFPNAPRAIQSASGLNFSEAQAYAESFF